MSEEVITKIDYMLNRHKAIKIWKNVPNQLLSFDKWILDQLACPLGWLAVEGYDGWTVGEEQIRDNQYYGKIPIYNGYNGFNAGSKYFGISVAQSMFCFGDKKHYKKFRKVTFDDVAHRLLSLPILDKN